MVGNEFTLMHKDVAVAEIELSEVSGSIRNVGTVYNVAHLPMGTVYYKYADVGTPDIDLLNAWWDGRSIPASRQGIDEVLRLLEIDAPKQLIKNAFGLSLSDHYWIKPSGADLQWSDINFFDHPFSEDMGEVLFGAPLAKDIDLKNPNNTSDGVLKKKWVIKNGARYLIKAGSGDFKQEPLNEEIASLLMARLGINHVSYEAFVENGEALSRCPNFLDASTEFVPARHLRAHFVKGRTQTDYDFLQECCEKLGILGFKQSMNELLVVDYILANEDRHYGNFGFIRHADTLEWLGCAPIFDTGNSLWFQTNHVGSKVYSKPFFNTHEWQLSLVDDLEWFEPESLKDFEQDMAAVLSKSDTISHERRKQLVGAVRERINRISELKFGV